MKTLEQKALSLAAELSDGEFPEDVEPQYVSWLLRSLVNKLIQSSSDAPSTQPAPKSSRAGE